MSVEETQIKCLEVFGEDLRKGDETKVKKTIKFSKKGLVKVFKK